MDANEIAYVVTKKKNAICRWGDVAEADYRDVPDYYLIELHLERRGYFTLGIRFRHQ